MKRDLAGVSGQGRPRGTRPRHPFHRAGRLPRHRRSGGQAVRNGQADRGIIVCGSGAGVSIAACKFPGVRAAVCHDTYTRAPGRRARRHERAVSRRRASSARRSRGRWSTRFSPRRSPAKSGTCAASRRSMRSNPATRARTDPPAPATRGKIGAELVVLRVGIAHAFEHRFGRHPQLGIDRLRRA